MADVKQSVQVLKDLCQAMGAVNVLKTAVLDNGDGGVGLEPLSHVLDHDRHPDNVFDDGTEIVNLKADTVAWLSTVSNLMGGKAEALMPDIRTDLIPGAEHHPVLKIRQDHLLYGIRVRADMDSHTTSSTGIYLIVSPIERDKIRKLPVVDQRGDMWGSGWALDHMRSRAEGIAHAHGLPVMKNDQTCTGMYGNGMIHHLGDFNIAGEAFSGYLTILSH